MADLLTSLAVVTFIGILAHMLGKILKIPSIVFYYPLESF